MPASKSPKPQASPPNVLPMKPWRFRSIWISDVHLGMRDCKAEFLLDFLDSTESQYLYLVGDIIDLWNMKNGWYWPKSHNNVLRKILKKAGNNTRVIFIPGNHDEVFRDYCGISFGGIEIMQDAIHVAADGRKFLVLHGDEFDLVTQNRRWLAIIGDKAYDKLLVVNRWFNNLRRRFGFPYWSVSAYLKHKVKNAVSYISNFEQVSAYEARRRDVDGLICGHIHKATIENIGDIVYCNDGDWVESCTALVEYHDGSLGIVHWADEGKILFKEQGHENRHRIGCMASSS